MKRSTVAAFGAGVVGGYIGTRALRHIRGDLRRPITSGARIVILGAGFAGISAASRIAKSLAPGARI